MAIRITTGMISGEYKNQMQTTLGQLEYYQKRAHDLRNFRKFSEDPVTASKVMRLRRSYTQNQDYRNNISTISDTYSMAEDAAMDIKDILDQAKDEMQGLTNSGTFPESDYAIYAKTLRGLQEDFVTIANSKLNDNYVFGGNDATKIPFSVSDDGKLLYRGLDVDTTDAATLEALSNESVYIDVGLGVNVSATGDVDEASVFNDTLNGLAYFGYGVDENGRSNNVYNILGEAATAIEKYLDGDETAFSTKIAGEYMDKIISATDDLVVSVGNLGIKVNQLERLDARLVNVQEDLNEQLSNLEYVDAEEAYTDLTWQQYVYNASLKIGSKLLQSSFLDYMS